MLAPNCYSLVPSHIAIQTLTTGDSRTHHICSKGILDIMGICFIDRDHQHKCVQTIPPTHNILIEKWRDHRLQKQIIMWKYVNELYLLRSQHSQTSARNYVLLAPDWPESDELACWWDWRMSTRTIWASHMYWGTQAWLAELTSFVSTHEIWEFAERWILCWRYWSYLVAYTNVYLAWIKASQIGVFR